MRLLDARPRRHLHNTPESLLADRDTLAGISQQRSNSAAHLRTVQVYLVPGCESVCNSCHYPLAEAYNISRGSMHSTVSAHRHSRFRALRFAQYIVRFLCPYATQLFFFHLAIAATLTHCWALQPPITVAICTPPTLARACLSPLLSYSATSDSVVRYRPGTYWKDIWGISRILLSRGLLCLLTTW